MLRRVSSLCLSQSLKVKLVRAGFQFTADLLPPNPQKLSAEAGLSEQETLELLQAVQNGGGGGGGGGAAAPLTALELLHKEEELGSIKTSSSQLDDALGGGLPLGKTTEICGAPGVGKTQLSLQAAVNVQVPRCLGGLEGQVMFMDTEGSFVLQRVVDIAAATVTHCSLLAGDQDQRAAMETFTVETILSNIFLVRCHDYAELLAQLHLLPEFLRDRPKLRLLVIDSVTFPFRQQLNDLSLRTRILQGLAQRLIAMATSNDVAVLITNQMTTRLRGGQAQLVPALGDTWGHAPNVRLGLHWEGSQRVVAVLKSPGQPNAAVPYQITSEGFRDAHQSEQLQRKRPRTHTDQSASSSINTSR
ncbi:DNA repair protein RAD51 homolog 3 [Cololabis saira]|uniref:DNA repair protein RAD51 homolog 3 n=1 Tax=Cololabis saira TaxID=129043 RepID=UPI002AD49490|nr:DNA repair protein RAD51 homolog 3 [Cololabis saira]